MNKPNDRQLNAINNYFSNGFDKKKALLDAGYKEKNIGQAVYSFFKSKSVQLEIQKRQEELKAISTIDASRVQEELWTIYQLSKAEKKYSDANRALQLLGQSIGAFTEKIEVNETGLSEVLKRVEQWEKDKKKGIESGKVTELQVNE